MDEKQIQELEPTGPDSFPGPLDVAGACKLTLQLSPVLLECPVWSWFLPGFQVAVSVPCCLLRPFCSHCWGAFSVSQTRNETKPDSTQPSRRCQSDPEHGQQNGGQGGQQLPPASRHSGVGWGQPSLDRQQQGLSMVVTIVPHSQTKAWLRKEWASARALPWKGPASSQPQASGHHHRG